MSPADQTTREPRTEALTAEEEAALRGPNLVGPGPCDDVIARLLATLDAARDQAATEARRELLDDVKRLIGFNVDHVTDRRRLQDALDRLIEEGVSHG